MFFQAKYDQTKPTPDTMTLWTDSESAEACALQVESKPASRHFILREFKVRGFSDRNPNRLGFCRTEYQRADALTKAASIKQHEMVLGKASLTRTSFAALFDAGILYPMHSKPSPIWLMCPHIVNKHDRKAESEYDTYLPKD